MKTLVLMVMALGFLSKPDPEKVKVLPKYDKSLYVGGGSCQCHGSFTSCTQTCDGGNCTCTCSFFSCSCTACVQLGNHALNMQDEQRDLSPVSISADQYKNIERLGLILKSNGDEGSLKAHNTLVDMIQMLKTHDYDLYQKTTDNFIKQLKALPVLSKNRTNTLFNELGVEAFRI